jgi:hypothetical protein
MTTLIVPCGGKSTRYGQGRPKWMRTHPAGELMLVEALRGITGYDRLIIGVVKEHIDTYKLDMSVLKAKLTHQVEPEFVIFDTFTSSQSETVYRLLDGILGPVFVKDCDNYFEHHITDRNVVCTSKLAADTNAVNKAYVELDKMGNLSGIVEKMVIGDQFCCGGYGFQDADEFRTTYERVSAVRSIDQGELYISHIIQAMLFYGSGFAVQGTSGYLDWGDKNVWERFCAQYKTLFIDIDGTLVQQSSEYFEPKWGQSEGLTNNIAAVNAMFDSGKVKVILTTSRKSECKDATETQLSSLGVRYHSIIYDLPHAQRVIVNDFSDSNPFPSAVAVNLPRNSDALSSMLE